MRCDEAGSLHLNIFRVYHICWEEPPCRGFGSHTASAEQQRSGLCAQVSPSGVSISPDPQGPAGSRRSRHDSEVLLFKVFNRIKIWKHLPDRTGEPDAGSFDPEADSVPIPIPDLRTIGDEGVEHSSPDLLEVIYQCQQRQDWYRCYARSIGLDPVPQVGSLSTAVLAATAASVISEALSFSVRQRGSSWSDAFARLRDRAEELGVLVMVSGVVGSNSHRRLDPLEFRGFALADSVTPVVFVNAADTKAAQNSTPTSPPSAAISPANWTVWRADSDRARLKAKPSTPTHSRCSASKN